MKKLFTLTLVLGSFYMSAANALINGSTRDCFSDTSAGKTEFCVTLTTASLPTMILGADVKEINQAEFADLLKAEAQNFVDGIDGDYLLLKKAAQTAGLSLEEVAENILK